MRRLLIVIVLMAVVAGGVLAWVKRHPEIEPVGTPSAADFDPDLVARGELLVAVGGCESCHAARSGDDLSGGLALATPFGTIYSTNITPDRETGIGRWSEAAFRRAMREGIDRAGGYLYPAFPYDHYTLVTDDDLLAIYAFLMSRAAVEAPPRPSELAFPFNFRWLMAGWNLLFLDAGPFEPVATRDELWNRGAYLVEGLGHCAACHSPRNPFGARDRASDYAGGDVEGWHAPALDRSSPAPLPWDVEAMINYLYDGWDERHGIAAGPMREVVIHMAGLPEQDVEAMAVYLVSLQEERPETEDVISDTLSFASEAALDAAEISSMPTDPQRRGLAVFLQRCANCHRSGSETVPLALATSVAGPDPRNFIRIVLDGVRPTENAYFVRPMPGFPSLTDEEVVDLVNFVRARFSRAPPWERLTETVRDIRAASDRQPAPVAGD